MQLQTALGAFGPPGFAQDAIVTQSFAEQLKKEVGLERKQSASDEGRHALQDFKALNVCEKDRH